jgi:type IV pilus modification protein PilV
MNRHCKRGARGFTLMEVLITMLLLSVGLLGVAALTGRIMHGNYLSKNITTATVIAETRLEDIRRAGYAAAAAGNVTDAVTMDGVPFSRLTSIAADSPVANTKTVTVTVSWDAGAQSVTLDTILAQQ